MTRPEHCEGEVGHTTALRDRGSVTASDRLFCDPDFHAGVHEMEALGLRVTAVPHRGSEPYGVLAGAGSRWFLLPLRPRAVCVASLALIQPMRIGPRALKRISEWTLQLGMPRTLLRNWVHVSGANRVAGVFGPGVAHNAFLTGTAGPHRKLVVQCMDKDGSIKGYAKVSRTPAVHALIANEAHMLAAVHALGLRSAMTPRVLLHEVRDGTAVLATDTTRALRRLQPTSLQAVHLAFLDELAAGTASRWAASGSALLHAWHVEVRGITRDLSAGWQDRFQRVLQWLEPQSALLASRGLAHGDFTPVNSYPYRDGLFIFDWEYAGAGYPADFDLIRFLDATAKSRCHEPGDRVAAILRDLHGLGRSEAEARARLAAYLCVYALRGACRQPRPGAAPLRWESGRSDAAMLDALLIAVCHGGDRGPGVGQPRPDVTGRGLRQHPPLAHEACRQTAPV